MQKKQRLILYTDSISKSDVHTFSAAAKTIQSSYISSEFKPVVHFVRSGQDIVKIINSQAKNSILSLDIISHGNQGGIHIARKLSTPVDSGFIQKRAHVIIRQSSDRPQTKADAEKIEESMHGLYNDFIATKGVSYYYNQLTDNSTDIRVLSDIEFTRFTDDAFVEFHGCRTAEMIPGLNSYFKDNFAKQFSDNLSKDSTVVGHIVNSNPNMHPNSKVSDYRHGKVRVYKGGKLIHDAKERSSLRLANSSTP